MAVLPDGLDVKAGDPILPAWERLKRFIRSRDTISNGSGFRINRTPYGSTVTHTGGRSFGHPFRVNLGSLDVQVRPGFVNETTPFLEGVPIDGIDPESDVELEVPRLSLQSGPGEDYRSFVALQARVDPETGQLLQDDETIPFEVVHRSSLSRLQIEGGSPDESGLGFQPLAIVYWTKDRTAVRQIRQVSHHNLGHRFVKGADGRPGRHFFWAL